jgi:GINS complex subunit 4
VQIELIEEKTASITDPKSGFSLIIMQTELERFKFLIRSFLRSRLAKVIFHYQYGVVDKSD